MDQRIPEPIQPVLQNYLSLMNQQLPGVLQAFYVEGSIALGGFNERFSDIDFIASLTHQVTPAQIEALAPHYTRRSKKVIRAGRWKGVTCQPIFWTNRLTS